MAVVFTATAAGLHKFVIVSAGSGAASVELNEVEIASLGFSGAGEQFAFTRYLVVDDEIGYDGPAGTLRGEGPFSVAL